MTTSQLDRFLAKVDYTSGACWTWTASRFALGYGQFRVIGHRGALAHRWSYEHFIGDIDATLEIDHLCRNPSCVNPTHLEAVTHIVNVQRGLASETAKIVQRGNTHFKGRRHTEEARAAMSVARRAFEQQHKGRKRTAETKAKISAAKYAYWRARREAA